MKSITPNVQLTHKFVFYLCTQWVTNNRSFDRHGPSERVAFFFISDGAFFIKDCIWEKYFFYLCTQWVTNNRSSDRNAREYWIANNLYSLFV